MQSPTPATTARRRVTRSLAAAAAALTLAPAAQAAEVTYNSGSGSTVTLRDQPIGTPTTPGDAFAPGAKIYLRGTGFIGTGGTGFPQVAVKLNDVDGELTYDGITGAFEPNLPTFQTEPDGTWTGWVKLKDSIAPTAPGASKPWLRILSGVPSSGSNVTVPISYQAYFRVQADLESGFTNTAGTYFPGSTITQGAIGVAAPSGANPANPGGPAFTLVGAAGKLDANEPITATLDGAPLTVNNAGTATAATTDGSGAFRAWSSLPATTNGERILKVSTSTKSEEITLKTVAHAATLQSPNVRPGGTALVTGTGFVGIDGKGQKVALVGRGPNAAGTVTDDAVLACEQADASGAVTLTATIHPTAAVGTPGPTGPILRVAAGTNCVPPLVSQPLPRFLPTVGLTISANAPQAGTTFTRGSVGNAFPVTGSGFAAGEAVQTKIDGANAGAPLTANANGEISGNVVLPAGVEPGKKILTFVGTTSTVAADAIEAIPAAAVVLQKAGPFAAGDKIEFDLIGFVRGFAREDGSTGQKVAIRFDAGRELLGCFATNDKGIAAGSFTIPAGTADGEHSITLLAGSACVSGASNDAPSRSIAVKFEVKNPVVPQPQPAAPQPTTPKPTTPVGPAGQRPASLKLSGTTKLKLKLDAGQATKVKVSVKTKSKTAVSGKGKKKIVTLVKSTTVRPVVGKARTVTLKLTADAKKLLKRLKAIKVVITVDPDGTGATTTRTITLRR